MAPVPKPIDWKRVEFAMMCSCNQQEIAASQGVHIDTLRDRFREHYGIEYSAYSNMLYSKGDVMLKEAQMKTALKGSTNMQIFLGQVRLGQSKPEGNTIPPLDADRDKEHSQMQKIHEQDLRIKELEARLGDNQPKAEPELL